MEKRTSLYGSKPEEILPKNIFERDAFKEAHKTTSGNGSIKLTTSGNAFVDDFAAIGNYRKPRQQYEVAKTMEYLWSIDPLSTLKETFYIRLITRNTKLMDGTELQVQRGQGLKSEFQERMYWLAVNHRRVFEQNIGILVAAGSWDDIFDILRLDLEYNGMNGKRLNWKFIIFFICEGLADESQTHLIRKYLPQIKAASKCKTMRKQCNNYIGKAIVNYLYGKPTTTRQKAASYEKYRQIKTSGIAHKWQQCISRQEYDKLNFNDIAGRALSILAKSKFLKNQGLEEAYGKWIADRPVAKYTGYVYELFPNIVNYNNNLKLYQKDTINKQFEGLLETARQNMNTQTRLLTCLDVSGSMTSNVVGTNTSSYNVGKAMALYFSELLEGEFSNTVLTFESKVKVRKFVGDTYVDKFYRFTETAYGSTNFLAVAEKFIELKRQGCKEEDFPTGILCISDGEFNSNSSRSSSTFNAFKHELRRAGFSEEYVDKFVIVLWDIPNTFYSHSKIRPKFESLCDEGYFYYMSGFDPAGIAFLTGTKSVEQIPRNALELFEAAMNQELLLQLKL